MAQRFMDKMTSAVVSNIATGKAQKNGDESRGDGGDL